jgi:hypothetical protein
MRSSDAGARIERGGQHLLERVEDAGVTAQLRVVVEPEPLGDPHHLGLVVVLLREDQRAAAVVLRAGVDALVAGEGRRRVASIMPAISSTRAFR